MLQCLACQRRQMVIVGKVGDWCVMENGTYIRIYGATEAPHMFPKFVPNKLVLQEVAYRTLVNGVGAVLVRDKKLTWPPLPFWLGSYCFKDVKEA